MSWVFFRQPDQQGTRACFTVAHCCSISRVSSSRCGASATAVGSSGSAPTRGGSGCARSAARSRRGRRTESPPVPVASGSAPAAPGLERSKRKWLFANTNCDRKVFTGVGARHPARARVTPRTKTMMARTGTRHRRNLPRQGEARDRSDHRNPAVVDRWDTGVVDIAGDEGLLAQVNGRSSAAVIIGDRLVRRTRRAVATADHPRDDRPAVGLCQGGARGALAHRAGGRPVPPGQEGQRSRRRGAPAGHAERKSRASAHFSRDDHYTEVGQ